jgi:rSAM/selenodomain-associated transferase 1
MSKDLLIIFTRNPELGKVKTRLSSKIGDAAALRIYNFLLEHTKFITHDLDVEKRVYYSDHINKNDLWHEPIYSKWLQNGNSLGDRMHQAFQEGYEDDFTNIILIGSDLYDLNKSDLENAFEKLRHDEIVIGPAKDGGYYLIGMKQTIDGLFKNKKWGSSTVLKETLQCLNGKSISLLPKKNDIDHYEDLEQFETLKNLIKSK